MKITKSQLKQIIKEELDSVLSESVQARDHLPVDASARTWRQDPTHQRPLVSDRDQAWGAGRFEGQIEYLRQLVALPISRNTDGFLKIMDEVTPTMDYLISSAIAGHEGHKKDLCRMLHDTHRHKESIPGEHLMDKYEAAVREGKLERCWWDAAAVFKEPRDPEAFSMPPGHQEPTHGELGISADDFDPWPPGSPALRSRLEEKMKITKSQLKQIIKEELENVKDEQ